MAPKAALLAILPCVASSFSAPRRPPGRAAASALSMVKYDKAAKEEKAENLLRDLDEAFEYEGRLPAAPVPAAGAADDFRCGFVGIVGAPNMGKSTMLNALIYTDLCVATNRPQTTRHAILGVLTTEDCQLCFHDTPGVIEDPAYKLQEGMMEAVKGTLKSSEVLLVVTDLFSTPIPDDNLFAKLQKSNRPTIVVINKVDLADKVNPNSDENDEAGRTITVFDAVARWRELLPNAMAIIPACASRGPDDVGVKAIRQLLTGGPDVPAAIRDLGRPIPGMFKEGVQFISNEEAKRILPVSPPLYDEDTLTDRSERFFASEMIRATLFEKLKKEMPYCCEVRVTEFKEPKPDDKNPAIRIKATILVERDSQTGIVVGKGGQKIKDVGVDARKRLEDFFGEKVHLDLFVKVDREWRRDEKKLKEYGYLSK